jgi:hypothetical protein
MHERTNASMVHAQTEVELDVLPEDRGLQIKYARQEMCTTGTTHRGNQTPVKLYINSEYHLYIDKS